MSTWILRAFAGVISLISWRAAGKLGAALGLLWFHVLRIRRKVVASNLALALPHRRDEHLEISREVYRNTGSNGLELIKLHSMAPGEIGALVTEHDKDRYLDALKRGKGVIVVTAHLGNYDLLAFSQAVAAVPLAIISKELHSRGSNRFWMETRRRSGLVIFPEHTAVRNALRWLRAGKVLGLVVDQRTGPSRGGILSPFMGVDVWTSTLAAKLSLRTGAALLPVRMERLDGGRHSMHVDEEIPVPGQAAPHETQVADITGRINAHIGGWVEALPGQWMWLHRRFLDIYK